MDKKHVSNIVAIIIGIFVIFSLGYLFFLEDEQEPMPTQNLENGDETPNKITYSQALLQEDPSNCKLLEDENQRMSCEIRLNECSDDDCFYKKATHTKNFNLCYEIQDRDLRAGCSASIQTSTLIRNSVVQDDISLCEEFEDPTYVDYCQDNYYLAKAINSGDKSYCEQIEREDMRNECL